MKKKILVLFILLFLSISYSQYIPITINYENSPTTIELYNLKGQRVFTKEFIKYNSIPFSLDNNLSNQYYIMRIKNAKSEFTRKFTPNNKVKFVGNFGKNSIKKLRDNEADSILLSKLQQPKAVRSAGSDIINPIADSMTNIIFINGVWNKRDKANDNINLIKNAYQDTLETFSGQYRFTLGYNDTQGEIGDIIQVIYQIFREAGLSDMVINDNLMIWLPLIVSTGNYLNNLRLNNGNFLSETVFAAVQNSINDAISRFTSSLINAPISVYSNEYATYLKLKKITDESFEKKERVIIFSHSQGNLYADELVKNFNYDEYIHTAALNIASPSTETSKEWYWKKLNTVAPDEESDGWYWTNSDDVVINLLRLANSNILPVSENYLLRGEDPREWTKHKFWESYFHDNLYSRRAIDNEFFKQCESLPFWKAVEKENDEDEFFWGWEPGPILSRFEVISSIVVHPSGKKILIVGGEKNNMCQAAVYDIEKGVLESFIEEYFNDVSTGSRSAFHSAVITNDGKNALAIGSRNNYAMYNFETKTWRGPLKVPPEISTTINSYTLVVASDGAKAYAVTSNGQDIVSFSFAGNTWDRMRISNEWLLGSSKIYSCVMDPNGNKIWAFSSVNFPTINLFDISTNSWGTQFASNFGDEGRSSWVYGLAATPDGKNLIVVGNNTHLRNGYNFTIRSLENNSWIMRENINPGSFACNVAITPDGSEAIIAMSDGYAVLYDFKKNTFKKNLLNREYGNNIVKVMPERGNEHIKAVMLNSGKQLWFLKKK